MGSFKNYVMSTQSLFSGKSKLHYFIPYQFVKKNQEEINFFRIRIFQNMQLKLNLSLRLDTDS